MDKPDLEAVEQRYHDALDAKPSKGGYTEAGIDALTDSVCDVPELVAWIKYLESKLILVDEEELKVIEINSSQKSKYFIASFHSDGGVMLSHDRWDGENRWGK